MTYDREHLNDNPSSLTHTLKLYIKLNFYLLILLNKWYFVIASLIWFQIEIIFVQKLLESKTINSYTLNEMFLAILLRVIHG